MTSATEQRVKAYWDGVYEGHARKLCDRFGAERIDRACVSRMFRSPEDRHTRSDAEHAALIYNAVR